MNKKMWYVFLSLSLSLRHTYPHTRKERNIIQPFAAKLTDLEGIMLSETIRQSDKLHDLTYMWNLTVMTMKAT